MTTTGVGAGAALPAPAASAAPPAAAAGAATTTANGLTIGPNSLAKPVEVPQGYLAPKPDPPAAMLLYNMVRASPDIGVAVNNIVSVREASLAQVSAAAGANPTMQALLAQEALSLARVREFTQHIAKAGELTPAEREIASAIAAATGTGPLNEVAIVQLRTILAARVAGQPAPMIISPNTGSAMIDAAFHAWKAEMTAPGGVAAAQAAGSGGVFAGPSLAPAAATPAAAAPTAAAPAAVGAPAPAPTAGAPVTVTAAS